MLKGGAGSDEWEDMGLVGRVTHATPGVPCQKNVVFLLVSEKCNPRCLVKENVIFGLVRVSFTASLLRFESACCVSSKMGDD